MAVSRVVYNVRITTHKYVVVFRVTVLDGRERGLSSRVDLTRKSSNITGVIAVGPLELFSKKRNKHEKAALPGHQH
jgi:hypothetical protein